MSHVTSHCTNTNLNDHTLIIRNHAECLVYLSFTYNQWVYVDILLLSLVVEIFSITATVLCVLIFLVRKQHQWHKGKVSSQTSFWGTGWNVSPSITLRFDQRKSKFKVMRLQARVSVSLYLSYSNRLSYVLMLTLANNPTASVQLVRL